MAIDRWRQPFTKLIKNEIDNITYVRALSQNNYLIGVADISSTLIKMG